MKERCSNLVRVKFFKRIKSKGKTVKHLTFHTYLRCSKIFDFMNCFGTKNYWNSIITSIKLLAQHISKLRGTALLVNDSVLICLEVIYHDTIYDMDISISLSQYISYPSHI